MKSIYRYRFAVLLVAILFLATCDGGGRSSETRAVIGPEGGTVTSRDGRLTLEIPPGALSEDTEITIRKINPDGVVPETDELVPEFAYVLEPDGLVFNLPVTASFDLNEDPVQEDGSLATTLAILVNSDGEVFEVLSALNQLADADTGSVVVSGELDHFSTLIAYAIDFLFSIEGVPSSIVPGGMFTATATISNVTGNALLELEQKLYSDRSDSPVECLETICQSRNIPFITSVLHQGDFEYLCDFGEGRYASSIIINTEEIHPFIVGVIDMVATVSFEKGVVCIDGPVPEPTPQPTPQPTPEPTPEPELGPCELEGVYESVVGNCGINSFTLTHTTGGDIALSGFGSNPGEVIFEQTGDPEIFESASSNLMILGQPGHGCELSCEPDNRVEITCVRSDGATCTQIFAPEGS